MWVGKREAEDGRLKREGYIRIYTLMDDLRCCTAETNTTL